MSRVELWCMVYCGVISMRFHPRNVGTDAVSPEKVRQEVDFAAYVADASILKADELFREEAPWRGLEQ